MAVITQTNVSAATGAIAVTVTTLGSSDTLVYSSGSGQWLELSNDTGSSATVNIDGSGSTTISPPGFGGTVSVASGYDVIIADGTTKIVKLDKIYAFMGGTVTLTGGTGVTAKLFV